MFELEVLALTNIKSCYSFAIVAPCATLLRDMYLNKVAAILQLSTMRMSPCSLYESYRVYIDRST